MVNLLRRRKDESRRSLLARHGKKKSRQLSDEQPAKSATTSSATNEPPPPRRKAKFTRYHAQTDLAAPPKNNNNINNTTKFLPKTPPLTPETREEQLHRAPVSDVTVGQGRIHLPKGKNSKKVVKDDEHTEYSDLTDNRTLKRLNEQKAKYEEALRQAEMRKKASTSTSQKNVKTVGTAASNKEALPTTQTPGGSKGGSIVDDEDPPAASFLSDILTMMDSACKSGEPEKVEPKDDFAPEWGVAPSMDHGERAPRETDTFTDDDAFTDLDRTVETDRKETSVSSPKTTHENFEMVLEELNEDDGPEDSPKRRSWKNPFKKGKKDQEEAAAPEQDASAMEPAKRAPPVAAAKKNEKNIEDKVKKALFPELEDDPVELNQLPPRNQAPQRKPVNPYGDEPEEEEKKEEPDDSGGQKKRFNRGIFRSFRRKAASTSNLEPVQEDAPITQFDDGQGGKGSSRVSSPRQHPVRKQVVDDIYRDLLDSDKGNRKQPTRPENSDPPPDKFQYDGQEGSTLSGGYSYEPISTYTAETSASGTGALVNEGDRKLDSTNGDHGVLGGFMAMITETVVGKSVSPDVENMSDHPNRRIPLSKSLDAKTTDNDEGEDPSVESLKLRPELRRSLSAPKNVQNNTFQQKAKQQKPLWKEVQDPNTGRSYFYHRKTRQTTWTRPKEMDMPPDEQDIEPRVVEGGLDQGQTLGRSRSPQTRLRELRERDIRGRSKDSTPRKNESQHDKEVREKKEEINRLLQAMAPPDGASVEELLAQYEGREDELLAYARKLKDSRPFDEPLGDEGEEEEDGDVVGDLNASHVSDSRNMSIMSRTRSGVTSKQSETTQQMANTRSRNKSRKFDDTTAGGTTLSSHGLEAGPVARVPSKIPVRVRSRELMVEDVSSDRKSETYTKDVRRGVPAGYGMSAIRHRPFTTPSYRAEAPPIVEENENDGDSSHGLNDSVSALSMNEMEFAQPAVEGMDDARRRALNDAIQREDWEMAEAISEGMKTLKRKTGSKPRTEPQEWKQSELDKFISENDWDAVSDYIANLRSRTLDSKTSREESIPESSKGKYSELPSRSKSSSFFTTGTGESEESHLDKGYTTTRPIQPVHYDDEAYSSYDESSSDYSDGFSSDSSPPRRRNARTRRTRRNSSRGRRRKGKK